MTVQSSQYDLMNDAVYCKNKLLPHTHATASFKQLMSELIFHVVSLFGELTIRKKLKSKICTSEFQDFSTTLVYCTAFKA